MYPDLDAKAREQVFTKEHKTVCIMQIGDVLKGGKPHDLRAPDYDDWSLNGDILILAEFTEIGHRRMIGFGRASSP